MGYYINPPTGTKEDFLKEFGSLITTNDLLDYNFNSDSLPVCLIDNYIFTAAGICYDKRELEVFLYKDDDRPVKWFLVTREILKPYYPLR
jgi:hypothetical protein